MTQWWSEHRCGEFFWATSQHDIRPHPDGYGCWEEAGRAVRFFLEHDTGTEPLARVTGKLAGYGAFPTDRFGVLLFSVHSAKREVALRAALRRATGGYDPGLVIATAARDHGHPDGPAGPIWPPGHPAHRTPLPAGTGWPNCRNGGRTWRITPVSWASRSARPPSTPTTPP